MKPRILSASELAQSQTTCTDGQMIVFANDRWTCADGGGSGSTYVPTPRPTGEFPFLLMVLVIWATVLIVRSRPKRRVDFQDYFRGSEGSDL